MPLSLKGYTTLRCKTRITTDTTHRNKSVWEWMTKTRAFWCGGISSLRSCTALLPLETQQLLVPLCDSKCFPTCLSEGSLSSSTLVSYLQWKPASISAGVSVLFTGHLSALLAPCPLCLLIIKLWIAAAMCVCVCVSSGFFSFFLFFSLCTKCQIAEIKNVNDGV